MGYHLHVAASATMDLGSFGYSFNRWILRGKT